MSEIKDSALKELAVTSFHDNINLFIRSHCRLDQLSGLEAPQVIIDNEQRLQVGYLNAVSVDARIAGIAPEDITSHIQSHVKGIIANFDQGLYHTGGYLGSLSRDSRPSLETINQLVQNGQLELPRNVADSDIESRITMFTDMLRRRREFQHLKQSFFLNADLTPLGQTTEVTEDQTLLQTNIAEVGVPLYPGRTLRLVISDQTHNNPPMFIYPENTQHLGSSFHDFNTPFYYDYPRVPKANIYIVKTPSPKILNPVLRSAGSLKDNITTQAFLELRQQFPPLPNLLSQTDQQDIRTILTDNSLLNRQRRLVDFLTELRDFISDAQSGEQSPGLEEYNIGELINSYRSDRLFPGTCKSASYLVAASCESLGLRTRIVRGSIFDFNEELTGGHQWPEVYVPTLKLWLPVDAQGAGALFTYPPQPTIYIAEGMLHVTDEKKYLKVV